MNFLSRHSLYLFVLLILPIIVLLPALLPGESLLPAAMLGRMLPWHSLKTVFSDPSPWNPLQFDGIVQFYPWRLFAARSLKSGYLPLWNPYQFCGTPFLANDQSAILYPFNLIFVIFPVAKAFGISAVLHLFLTGSFLYGFVLKRTSRPAALLAGIIWQLSAWQISWLALPTFLCTSCWIPLALLFVDRAAEKPSAINGVTLGLILGNMLLAGHLQVAFYGLLIVGSYAIFNLISISRNRPAYTLACILSLIVMILISSAQLLPTFELAAVSHRSGGHPSLAGYTGYISLAMRPIHLVTVIVGGWFGRNTDYWGATNFAENACFFSVTGLLLALLSVTRLFKESIHVRFFAVLALITLLLSLGTPLNYLTYFVIPGFGQTGSPARILGIWTLCGAILAGYGFDALLKGRCPKASICWVLAITVSTIAFTFTRLNALNPAYLQNINTVEIGSAIGLLITAIGSIVWLHQSEKPPTFKVALVIAIAAVELMRVGVGYNLVASDDQIYPVTQTINWLQQNVKGERVLFINDPDNVYESPGVMPPNSSTAYGLFDVAGYDSLQTKQYKAFINSMNGNVESSPLENGNMILTHVGSTHSPEALLANARYIVSDQPLKIALPEVYSGSDGLYVYKNPAAYPIAWEVKDGVFHSLAAINDCPSRLIVNGFQGNSVTVAIQYYPGWIATQRNRTLLLSESPEVFQTIREATPGDGAVKLQFKPSSFRIGLYCLCIGLLLTTGLFSASWKMTIMCS